LNLNSAATAERADGRTTVRATESKKQKTEYLTAK
jgi:hypothetical protein